MKESLPTEHDGELLRDTFEQFLDGGAVADERGGHLQTSWWNVADGGFDVVGDPFHEVAAVFVLDVQHLFIDFFHGHAPSENSGDCQVSAVTWIAGSHHVLGVKHLLRQFRYRQGPVLLASS